VALLFVGGEWLHESHEHRADHVPDIASADAEATRLGARVLQKADFGQTSGFVVYADPAGHPFCLCWG
jgi:predicted enzyme related to lactoylglutathione lyase